VNRKDALKDCPDNKKREINMELKDVSEYYLNENDRKLVEEVQPKLIQKSIDYLIKGTSRWKLKQYIEKNIGRLSTKELRIRVVDLFVRQLLSGIQEKRVFHRSNSCLFLYRVWTGIGATTEQWKRLKEMPWYHTPSEEVLRADEHRSGIKRKTSSKEEERNKESCSMKSTIEDSPPRKRGAVSVLPQESLPGMVKVSSIVVVPQRICKDKEKEEAELRNRIVQRMSRKQEEEGSSRINDERNDGFVGALSRKHLEEEKIRNARSAKISKKGVVKQKFAIIDLEGTAPNIVEIAVILCDMEEIIEARWYLIRVRDRKSVMQGAKYCHGISYDVCQKYGKYELREAVEEIREWLEGQCVVVLSADENRSSDVSQFVDGWRVRYVNVCLPRWKDRLNTPAYMEVQVDKRKGVKVVEAECPYRLIHDEKLLINQKKLQLLHGAHCSLADSKHLYRHIQLNHLWPMIIELAKYVSSPHKFEENESSM
jgi:hypothetical protein